VVLSDYDVFQIERYVERTLLEDGRFARPEIFGPQDILVLRSVAGVDIKLDEVFGEAETLSYQFIPFQAGLLSTAGVERMKYS